MRGVQYFPWFLKFYFEMAWITEECSFSTGSHISFSSLFCSHPQISCLSYLSSLSSSAPVYLSVYSSLLTQSQSALIVHRVRLPLEPRRGRVSVFTLVNTVYFEAASNSGKSHVAWMVHSDKNIVSTLDIFTSDVWLNVKTNSLSHGRQCEIKQWFMIFISVSPMHFKGLSALKPHIVVFERRN